MKRLSVVVVLAAVLAMCSQSYGYVLSYDIWGLTKAVDTTTNTMERTGIFGKLVLNIDEEQGVATEGRLILYNRLRGAGVYTVSEAVNAAIYGNSLAALMDTSWMGGQIIMTGNINTNRRWRVDIGLAERKNIANSMDGSIHLNGGMLFDISESLVGAGTMAATLNLQATRAANINGDSVADVADGIISWLVGKGFTELTYEEPIPS
jgi:hypothetical protein